LIVTKSTFIIRQQQKQLAAMQTQIQAQIQVLLAGGAAGGEGGSREVGRRRGGAEVA